MDEHLTGVFAWSACCLFASSIVVWWLFNDPGFDAYPFNLTDAVLTGVVAMAASFLTMRWLSGRAWIAFPLSLSYWCAMGFTLAFLGQALNSPDLTWAPLGAAVTFMALACYHITSKRTTELSRVETITVGTAALALSLFAAWATYGDGMTLAIASFGSIGASALAFLSFRAIRMQNKLADGSESDALEVIHGSMVVYFQFLLFFIVVLQFANLFGRKKRIRR